MGSIGNKTHAVVGYTKIRLTEGLGFVGANKGITITSFPSLTACKYKTVKRAVHLRLWFFNFHIVKRFRTQAVSG